MKINFENPPDWLLCNCYRCVAIRITIGGSALLPVCDCGTILAAKVDDVPRILDRCPECSKAEQVVGLDIAGSMAAPGNEGGRSGSQ